MTMMTGAMMTDTGMASGLVQFTPLMKRIAVAYVALRSVRAHRAILKDLLKREDCLLGNIGLTRAAIEQALLDPMSEDAAVLLMRVRIAATHEPGLRRAITGR